MIESKTYDCAIIGGGLGGLTLSIQLARQGHSVILFEKEQYPFHKVCGEYISLESIGFLESIGLPLIQMKLPVINKLEVTAPGGTRLLQELPLGGIGISRYRIDNELVRIARENGVTVLEGSKVETVVFRDGSFLISTRDNAYLSQVCCAAFGKRSNIDIRWNRPFTRKNNGRLNNFIAVKYHIKTDHPADSIALHNFKDGYCGISKIEDDKYCLCYLTRAANLKKCGNSIERMEKDVLGRNSYLKKIFENSTRIYEQPLTISQVSFSKKSRVENHVLMIGDAAGMITPLCGNGMSMAMHGGKLATGFIDSFLKGETSRSEMETRYDKAWNDVFAGRLRAGRIIQRFFGKPWLTRVFIMILGMMPPVTRWIIRQTHGRPF